MYQTRPDDYAAFRCLAGACPQTCCAAWEIVVDPDAQDAYLRLQHPLAAKLRRALRVDSEGDTYFAQTDGRCPFLCVDGLCELQRTLGEQSLCRTCRDFPRWEVLLCDRVEQGLSPACPEAAQRLLARSAPLRFVSAPLPDDTRTAAPYRSEPVHRRQNTLSPLMMRGAMRQSIWLSYSLETAKLRHSVSE